MTTTPPHAHSPSGRVVRDRLAQMGWELPQATDPVYAYEPVMVWGDLAFVSGQIPRRAGEVVRGLVGVDRTVDEAHDAASLCALSALGQLDAIVGLDRVAQVLKLTVYIASGPDVESQPEAAEGASSLLVAALGEAGRHARTALGVPHLPKGALAEIDLVVGLHPA